MNENKEINAGYEITEKLTVGNSVFVLGKNETRYGTKFVTWEAKKDSPTDYFWGHYIGNYPDAREDLYKRAFEEAQMINPGLQKRMDEKLPDFCMSTQKDDGHLIVIKKDGQRYEYADISSDEPAENKEMAKYFNNLLGVTKAQETAMLAGCTLGWNMSAANPANYDNDGNPIKSKPKSRDDAR